ncbi:TlpA family protein disulfide reductase [Aequorivita sinensis]|uniref:TlpA family protein disulfide reductase n=1 Tax=Aequorivita sinensis TaxID=1382458 RepID=UPI001124B279|nr:hypothetical protein [Aequorivita sinensis]
MFRKLLLLLSVLALFSCKNKEENTVQSTYIRGQIINPTLDYVIFSKGNIVLDTIPLDENNFFEYSTDKIKAGLHLFSHSEGQVFYIEPGDSLLIHINTIDFDESLAFSGKGGDQNNLLIELYLKNEKENQNLPKWYSLSSEEFQGKIDSLKASKLQSYEEFIANNKVSESFKDIALSNIEYDYYSKKELYGAANRNTPAKFSDDFFNYRKNIDFNKDELKFYYPYYRFLNRYFENMVCTKYNENDVIDRNSFDYNYKKIHIIDSVVASDSIRNRLLRYNTIMYLFNAQNEEEETRLFEAYKKMNTDKKYLNEVEQVYNASIQLIKGKKIPNVLLVNTENVLNELTNVINAPTVLFFWRGQPAIQHRNLHKRASELKAKFPQYDFIGVNTDTHFKRWRDIVYKSKYDSKFEYQIENLTDAEKKFILRYINYVIVIDKDGIILDGKTNMFNIDFEDQLQAFLNE